MLFLLSLHATGFYFGGQVGLGGGSNRIPFSKIDKHFLDFENSKTAFLYGGFIGFGVNFNSFYMGINADILGNTSKQNKEIIKSTTKKKSEKNSDENTSESGTFELARQVSYSPTLRLGYFSAPKTLFYVKFGVNFTKYKYKASGYFGQFEYLSITSTRLQPHMGIGIDYTFCDNVFLKVEYAYSFRNDIKRVYRNEGKDITHRSDYHHGLIGIGCKLK